MTATEMLLSLDTIEAMNNLWQEQDEAGHEDESDATYREMWSLFEKVADELVRITSGKVDKKIAHTMVFRQGDKLREIVKKAA